MELTLDTTAGLMVNQYHADEFIINQQSYPHSVLLNAKQVQAAWSIEQLEQLTVAHCQEIIDQQPELVIIGSGASTHFLSPELIALFGQHRIGLEIMTTDAACRTYNILVSEGRDVLALLLLMA